MLYLQSYYSMNKVQLWLYAYRISFSEQMTHQYLGKNLY